MSEHVYALILAGGGGTRLWPKSREKTPKQFLKLGSDKTLLRMTGERVRKIVDWDRIYVITNKTQYADVRRELPEVAEDHIIQEPQKRETAMAMAVGANVIAKRDHEAVVMNFGADHVVENVDEFVSVMRAAAEEAKNPAYLVTVGISPLFPHTGLGYIKINKKLHETGGHSVYGVDSFTEKPNLEKATEFIATGKYYWNANNYVWSVAAIGQAMQKHAPKMQTVLGELWAHIGTPGFAAALEKAYEQVEPISIDYAVSEKADNLLLIPGDFGWNDVGDWKIVYELGKKDASGNVVLTDTKTGELVEHNSKNNLVQLNGRLVALVDMEDCIVVDTEEILLVMPREKSQDVKKVVEQLKNAKKKQYL